MSNSSRASYKIQSYKIQRIQTLKLENDGEAQKLLKRACVHVKPIMQRRQWKVPLVMEFTPTDPKLQGLNENKGQVISIRLRHHDDLSKFHNYEHILSTLLHELTHIEHGPHNKTFYKLLDQLKEEAKRDGTPDPLITGEGRKLNNQRVNPFHSSIRDNVLRAAEKRRQTSIIMSNKPRRLGGYSATSNLRSLSPRRAAAMAALKRFETK